MDAIQVREVVDRLVAATSRLSRGTIDNTVSKLVEDNHIFRDVRGVGYVHGSRDESILGPETSPGREVSIQRPPPSDLAIHMLRRNEFTRRSGP